MSFLKSIRKILTPSIVLLCGVCIIKIQFSKLADISGQVQSVRSKNENLQIVANEEASLELLKRSPSFGFDNLIADWAFLRFLQYFGDGDARSQTGYTLSPEYFEIIVDRDPKFVKPYLFLSISTSLYAGEAHRTVALMNKGLQSLSSKQDLDSYLIRIYKATDELLFLGDTKAAQESYMEAAEWAFASEDPSIRKVGAVAAKTATFLSKNPDSKRAQANAWLMVLSNAVDDTTRQRALKNIAKLGGRVNITENNTVSIELPEGD